MDDKTIAVLVALKIIREWCDDQDSDIQDMIEPLREQGRKISKDDAEWLESLYGQSLVWSQVGTKVGNMINDTLFTALDLQPGVGMATDGPLPSYRG